MAEARRKPNPDAPPRPPGVGPAMKRGERELDGRGEEIVAAMERSNGIKAIAALQLGVHRDTLVDYLRDCPELAARVAKIREVNIDYVEGKLFSLIKNNVPSAVMFFLQTQAKDRGYSLRVEQTGPDGGAVKHEMTIVPPSPDAMLDLLQKLAEERAKRLESTVTTLDGHAVPQPNGHDPDAS